MTLNELISELQHQRDMNPIGPGESGELKVDDVNFLRSVHLNKGVITFGAGPHNSTEITDLRRLKRESSGTELIASECDYAEWRCAGIIFRQAGKSYNDWLSWSYQSGNNDKHVADEMLAMWKSFEHEMPE